MRGFLSCACCSWFSSESLGLVFRTILRLGSALLLASCFKNCLAVCLLPLPCPPLPVFASVQPISNVSFRSMGPRNGLGVKMKTVTYTASLCCCLVPRACPSLCALWTVAHQAPLSMGFPRQEYWSGLPFPSPGDLAGSGIKPRLLLWQADSLLLSHLRTPLCLFSFY